MKPAKIQYAFPVGCCIERLVAFSQRLLLSFEARGNAAAQRTCNTSRDKNMELCRRDGKASIVRAGSRNCEASSALTIIIFAIVACGGFKHPSRNGDPPQIIRARRRAINFQDI